MKATRLTLTRGFTLACIVSLLIAVAFSASPAQAAGIKYIRDNGTGGDCASIGTWDNASKTCTLAADQPLTNIVISNNGLTLDGAGHAITGSSTGYGIDLTGRSNVKIKNISVSGFSYGIYLYGGSGHWITDNTLASNSRGIYVRNSSGNIVSGNSASSNSKGIAFLNSPGNSITGNSTSGNSFGIELSGSTSTANTVSSNNTNADYDGIYLNSSANSNIISGNVVMGSTNAGIHLVSSSSNTINGNTCSNGVTGLLVDSSSNNNVARQNLLSGNSDRGIGINSASSNTFIYNTVSGNAIGYGVSLIAAIDNVIYNNSFLNNGTQAYSWSGSGNLYNVAAPVGGNYYDTYDSPAEGCFDVNADGFCDSPFVFWSGQDNLPWTTNSAWCGKPSLSLMAPQPYWSSFSDYLAGWLSLSWSIRNRGTLPAADVLIVSNVNSNGVNLLTALPISFGDISGGATATQDVVYSLPEGLIGWRTAIGATAADACGTTYAYP